MLDSFFLADFHSIYLRSSFENHSPSHSSNVASTSRRRERNRSPSRHSSRSRHRSSSSSNSSSESSRARRRRRRRHRTRSSDSDSSKSHSESESSSSSEGSEAFDRFADRFEVVLNNIADRVAPKTSGVHAAAKFLPPSSKAFRTTEAPPPSQAGKKGGQARRHPWQRNLK